MKNVVRLLIACVAVWLPFMAGSAPVHAQEGEFYAVLDYMSVPEGKDELYLSVEKVWSKMHAATRESGIQLGWFLAKVNRFEGPEPGHQYVTVQMYDSWDKINDVSPQWNEVFERLSDEEKAIVNRTGESRSLVNSEIYRFVTSVAPLGPRKVGTKFTVGYMKSKDRARHMQLEMDYWKKIWAKRVEDGHLHNWSLWDAVYQFGENAPYNLLAVQSGWSDEPMGDNWFQNNIAGIFPDLSEDEIREQLGQTGDVRDIPIVDELTILVNDLDE